jgi:mono/diheme cytochrome c family protein
MKRILNLAMLLAVAPLLMAALWMDNQPSYKPYQAPVLAPPVGSVPISGKEIVSQATEPRNPITPTKESLEQGKALFAINCAMCHGQTSTEHGPVGKKLNPPPPGLDQDLVRERSDAHIFKAITFGFGRMPPFKDKLTPRERWDLVNFLRTRK